MDLIKSFYVRVAIKLNSDVLEYPLPEIDGKFLGVYFGGIKLSSKVDGTDDWEWDFEIENNVIKFSRVFICLLDWKKNEENSVQVHYEKSKDFSVILNSKGEE